MKVRLGLGCLMKKALCFQGIALLVAGALGAIACTSRVPSYDDAIVMAVGDTANEAAFKRMVAAYEGASKPVRAEFQGAQDYNQWLAIQFIGRKPPAIVSISAPNSSIYGAHEGSLVAYDPYLDQINPLTGKRWRDQFIPGVLDVCKASDGRIYVIPFDVVKVAFYYNKTIFRALGLEPPSTWAEFMHVCRVIDEQSESVIGYKVTPCAVGTAVPSGVTMWNVGTFCDSLFRPLIPKLDISKPDKDHPGVMLPPDGFIDPEELTRGYKLGIIDPMGPEFRVMWQLFKDWSRYWGKDFAALRDEDVRPLFLRQRAAIAMDGSWWAKTLPLDLENIGKGKSFEFGVFPLPPVTEESYPLFNHPFGSLGTVGNGFAVTNFNDQETIDEAVSIIRYCSTPPVILEASETLNLPTVRDVPLLDRFADFRPLLDGTFPFLKFGESWFPDAQSTDEWFKSFQEYLKGNLDIDTFRAKTRDVINVGVERAIVANHYDTASWGTAEAKAVDVVDEMDGVDRVEK